MAKKIYSGDIRKFYHQRKLVEDLSREPGLLRGFPFFGKKHTMALLRPKLVASLVKPAVRGMVLEVGIGAGPLTQRLLKEKGVQEIHGVDISLPLLKKARARGAKPIAASGGRLPYKPESFDSAVCLDTLGHIEDPKAFVRGITEALRPGGKVVLNVVERGMTSSAIAGEAEERGEPPFNAFSRKEVEEIVRKSGLEIEKTKGVRFFPFLPRMIFVYARKPRK